jgi:hypothetical protein
MFLINGRVHHHDAEAGIISPFRKKHRQYHNTHPRIGENGICMEVLES